MSTLLQPKQIIYGDLTQQPYMIESFLGAGTQGEVYRAQIDNQAFAIKWYFPHYIQNDATLRKRLENAIKKGSPDNNFLWPLELVVQPQSNGFGYVMPLRPSHFKSIVDLMRRRAEPSFYALISACLKLSESFLQLHAKGLCYRDINFNNVFFDPNTGDILICDNDNVDVNGATGAINGTPRFMAPELVRGDAPPNTESDLFSLSILLFYMLMLHHPLEGKKEASIRCFDQAAMNKLYGTEPLFIFDPNDDSNAPVPHLHENALIYWTLYPPFLREVFTRAFTAGINDQHGRIRENEWRVILINLRDSVFYCRCGGQNFYYGEGVKQHCWACNQTLVAPPRLQINNALVMLNHDTKLYLHHTDQTQKFNFSTPQAAVTRHPQDPNRWGLQNLSSSAWTITLPDNTLKTVEPKRSVNLTAGISINFGNTMAEICV
jgi:eukaryotic-like serine/threonine-protein kinase